MINKKIQLFLSLFYKIKFRFVRFLITGVINTLFSLSIYWFLVWLDVHYSLAMFISNMLGILFNFKTTGKLVFENSDNFLIFKFVAVNVLIYILSLVGLKLFFLLGVDKYSAAVIIAPPMAVISYLINKKYVFINTEIK